MEINYFDIVVTLVILFLGLKGILNGFFKEAFGLIGIVGGIFVASRLGDSVGLFLSDLIFKFDNNSAVAFTGFIVTLALFWLIMIGIGLSFKQLCSLSGLGPVDKLFGFLLGASKFFFIAAVITHSMYNIKAIKTSLDETSLKTSILVPILVEVGSYIMKLDPVEVTKEIDSSATSLKTKANELINKSVQEMAANTMKELKKSMPDMDN
ncbi:CvpA family protein [Sulfurimonas sp. SAG-AH-194-I05]|nr:CvpA family protein [Sulfurimonas sp. SAG-AH-194-I05]MDF1874817.1 CvpA family protein [Sulfurimonas sp. SAG-AH-194-I05]